MSGNFKTPWHYEECEARGAQHWAYKVFEKLEVEVRRTKVMIYNIRITTRKTLSKKQAPGDGTIVCGLVMQWLGAIAQPDMITQLEDSRNKVAPTTGTKHHQEAYVNKDVTPVKSH